MKGPEWKKRIASLLRWTERKETLADRRALGELVGHRNLQRVSEEYYPGRATYAIEVMLEAIRMKYEGPRPPYPKDLLDALDRAQVSIERTAAIERAAALRRGRR